MLLRPKNRQHGRTRSSFGPDHTAVVSAMAAVLAGRTSHTVRVGVDAAWGGGRQRKRVVSKVQCASFEQLRKVWIWMRRERVFMRPWAFEHISAGDSLSAKVAGP